MFTVFFVRCAEARRRVGEEFIWQHNSTEAEGEEEAAVKTEEESSAAARQVEVRQLGNPVAVCT